MEAFAESPGHVDCADKPQVSRRMHFGARERPLLLQSLPGYRAGFLGPGGAGLVAGLLGGCLARNLHPMQLSEDRPIGL